jgi:hypothetical protein
LTTDHNKLVLSGLLSSAGWCIEDRQTEDLEWWADEIWVIRSEWHPTDFRLFLTFLVDPTHEGHRAKGQAVWALEATQDMPKEGHPDENAVRLQLIPKFERGLEQFIDEIGEVRNSAN